METYSFFFPPQGDDKTNPLIWTFIIGQENHDNDEVTLLECYIYFLHNYMSFVTKEKYKKLEDHATHSMLCMTTYKTYAPMLSQDSECFIFLGLK
jgi:hypothetical protein